MSHSHSELEAFNRQTLITMFQGARLQTTKAENRIRELELQLRERPYRDGATRIEELEAERDRLREAIEVHRRSKKAPWSGEAGKPADERLWKALEGE